MTNRIRFEGASNQLEVRVQQRGRDVLRHPLLNKGTAFSVEERAALGLEGLLPSCVMTLDSQLPRVHESIKRKQDPLEQYIGLASLQDRNETLFYRLLLEHTEELAPIVYTPTVGEACQTYSHIFRRGRGVWITPDHRGRIASVLANCAGPELRLIVVTDNERILGLGDQGAGGMGIPIGKLALYTMGAGIHPSLTLPVSLDVGTDNEALLADDLYVGYRQKRLRGKEYDALIEEFVHAVKERFPQALLQWEDFKKANAFELLDRYRKVLPSFNDDIQGTAGVVLAGVMAACRAKRETLAKQRVLILGAGAAGIGIALQLRDAMIRDGVQGEALTRAIAVLDSQGLVLHGRERIEKHKLAFAWPLALAEAHGLAGAQGSDLESVVRALRPTIIIGTSGQPGIFDEPVVRAMAEFVDKPLVFPLSNPTSMSEARPADVIEWTKGRALVATGSPFEPLTRDGKLHRFSQANNVYVFPGVGLGAIVAEVSGVTDSMFTVAAQELAAAVSEADLAEGALFPPLSELRTVSARIAGAVVREARSLGLGRPIADDAIPAAVEAAMWYPAYPKLIAS